MACKKMFKLSVRLKPSINFSYSLDGALLWRDLRLLHELDVPERDDDAHQVGDVALEADEVLADVQTAISVLLVERRPQITLDLRAEDH